MIYALAAAVAIVALLLLRKRKPKPADHGWQFDRWTRGGWIGSWWRE